MLIHIKIMSLVMTLSLIKIMIVIISYNNNLIIIMSLVMTLSLTTLSQYELFSNMEQYRYSIFAYYMQTIQLNFRNLIIY